MAVCYYQCRKCNKKTIIKDDKTVPSCCGKPMKKIPVDICLQPDHPEHARTTNQDDACDDFRGG